MIVIRLPYLYNLHPLYMIGILFIASLPFLASTSNHSQKNVLSRHPCCWRKKERPPRSLQSGVGYEKKRISLFIFDKLQEKHQELEKMLMITYTNPTNNKKVIKNVTNIVLSISGCLFVIWW